MPFGIKQLHHEPSSELGLEKKPVQPGGGHPFAYTTELVFNYTTEQQRRGD